METGLFSWPNFHGLIFLNSIYKAFGPSLGVTRMWIERNDHAPKSECVEIFQHMPKKGNFDKEKEKSSLSIVLSSSSLSLSLSLSLSPPPQKRNHCKTTIASFLCYGPLLSSTIALILPLPPQNLP